MRNLRFGQNISAEIKIIVAAGNRIVKIYNFHRKLQMLE